MRWKYRKLVVNLGNAVEAVAGAAGAVVARRRPGGGRGRGGLRRRGHRPGVGRGGHGPAGRPAAHARRSTATGGRADRRGRAWPGEPAPSRPTTSTARSCCSAASTGCPTPVNELLQRLAREAAAEPAARRARCPPTRCSPACLRDRRSASRRRHARADLGEPALEEGSLGRRADEAERGAVVRRPPRRSARGGAAGRPGWRAAGASGPGGGRRPPRRSRPGPRPGPSAKATATARFSSTTGDGARRASTA